MDFYVTDVGFICAYWVWVYQNLLSISEVYDP